MSTADTPGGSELLSHVLVPVANAADARKTARALAPYDPERVTALHVVEKGEGVPDKTPVEQSEGEAAEAYAAVREQFPEAGDHTAYGRDIASAIFEAAEDIEASAIVYRSRGSGRLMQFLSGDIALKLVTETDRPVIALPTEDDR